MGFLIRKLIDQKWAANRKKDALRLQTQTLPAGVEVRAGLAYLPDRDPMHTLNLYRPAGAEGPLPAVVDIHGGGWMHGDRELNRGYCMSLAAQGYAVMGMSFRLLPHVGLREQVQDVFASLRWLEDHGAEYGFDLSYILLTGDSAGGHLAGLTACIQKSPALQALYGVEPLTRGFTALAIAHGVCDIYRFSFLRPPLDQAVTREYQSMFFGPRWKRSPSTATPALRIPPPAWTCPPFWSLPASPTGTTPRAGGCWRSWTAPLWSTRQFCGGGNRGSISPTCLRSTTGTGRRAGRQTGVCWTSLTGRPGGAADRARDAPLLSPPGPGG